MVQPKKGEENVGIGLRLKSEGWMYYLLIFDIIPNSDGMLPTRLLSINSKYSMR